jgi:hypothetical protein
MFFQITFLFELTKVIPMFTFQLVEGGKQLVAKENPSKALPHSYTIELKDTLEAGKTIKVRN